MKIKIEIEKETKETDQKRLINVALLRRISICSTLSVVAAPKAWRKRVSPPKEPCSDQQCISPYWKILSPVFWCDDSRGGVKCNAEVKCAPSIFLCSPHLHSLMLADSPCSWLGICMLAGKTVRRRASSMVTGAASQGGLAVILDALGHSSCPVGP